MYIDRPAFIQTASALPGPSRPLPTSVVSAEVAAALTPDNRSRPILPDVVFTTAGAPPALAAQMAVTRPARLPQPLAVPLATLAAAAQHAQPATSNAALLPGAQQQPVAPAASIATAAAAAPPASAASAAAASTTAPTPAAAQPAASGVAPQPAQPAAALPQVFTATTTATGSVVPSAATPAPSRLAAAIVGSAAAAGGSATQQQVVGRRVLSLQVPRHAAVQDNADTDAGSHQHQLPGGVAHLAAAAHAAGVLEHIGPADEPVVQQLWLLQQQQAGSGPPQYDQRPESSSTIATSTAPAARALLQLQDHLDAFRRGAIRAECAEAAARTWRPYAWFNISDTISGDSRYQAVLSGGDVVGILSALSAALNGLRQQQPQPVAASAPAAGSG